ncbi:MAG: deoxyribonuclease V [Verrucomicrobia bacterium]|nr:deoxyribonuclease V [Verrucomicrobiota bacterium]
MTISIHEAKELQTAKAAKVILGDDFGTPRFIGGMDVSCNLYDPTKMIYAAVVVLDLEMNVVEKASVAIKQTFPYVPGLLAFREAPALVAAFHQLKIKPDLILVDGHGISHPRGLGVASHIGVLLDIPTIGVAKSILVGEIEGNCLVWKDETIATVYQSKPKTNPLYISTGHRISLPSAINWVQLCMKKYRLPEPTRQAHIAANECRRENTKNIAC